MTQSNCKMSFAQKFGLKYYAYLINCITVIAVYQNTKCMELTLFCILVIIPGLTRLLPPDDQFNTPNAKQINKQNYHMWAPATFCFVVYGMIYYFWINYQNFNYSYSSIIAAILALDFSIGTSIDGSHELIHRPEIYFRVIGFLGLVPFQFTTYPIQHLYMHHKLVGTPYDAITAPKNSNLYFYYIKAVFSSYKVTFEYSKLFFAFCMALNWSYFVILFKFAIRQYEDNYLAISKVFFFVVFVCVALLLMESVQYIQHYGLVYRKNAEEAPVLQISSWNAVHNPYYNWSVFRFQRHSDHHMNAYKIYSTMDLNQKMPQFPFQFTTGILLSMFPSLWCRAMNPLADAVLQGKKAKQSDVKTALIIARSTQIVVILALIYSVYSSKWGSQLFS